MRLFGLFVTLVLHTLCYSKAYQVLSDSVRMNFTYLE